MNKLGSIADFMMDKGYLEHHAQDIFRLTDLAREAKLKGGHTLYYKYLAEKDNAIMESLVAAKQSAQFAKESADSTKKIATYTLSYVLITLAILIVAITTCHYQKNSSANNNPNSKIERTVTKK